MLRRKTDSPARSMLALLAMSGMLAGCNARESLYSQGPWGPRDMQRSYPQYSSPWGSAGKNTVLPSDLYANRSLVVAPSQDSARTLAEPRLHQQIAGLPADPLPATSEMDRPASTEQVLVLKETSLPVPNRASAPAESPPGVFSAPRRASSYAGAWKAKDGKSGSCLIHLSSTASLDHYKASASKCSNQVLQSVSTWSFNQNLITLFSHGVEVAHLSGSEAALSGTLSGAGTRLDLSR